MKTLRATMSLAMLLIMITACAHKVTFPSLANQDGITNIYVNKFMIGNIGKSGGLPGYIPDSLVKKLDSIEVITADENPQVTLIRDTVKEYINANKQLEVVLNVNDDGDNVTIYGLPVEGSDVYSKLIMYVVDEDGDTVLIVMNGKFNPEDLNSISI